MRVCPYCGCPDMRVRHVTVASSEPGYPAAFDTVLTCRDCDAEHFESELVPVDPFEAGFEDWPDEAA